MNTYDEDFVIHVAECTAVLAMALEEEGLKLGGEGLIAHYCAVAQCGLEVAELFPPGFDWDEHMSRGGDCWDMEVWNWMHRRLFETKDIPFDYWGSERLGAFDTETQSPNPWHRLIQPAHIVKKRQDVDLTLPG